VVAAVAWRPPADAGAAAPAAAAARPLLPACAPSSAAPSPPLSAGPSPCWCSCCPCAGSLLLLLALLLHSLGHARAGAQCCRAPEKARAWRSRMPGRGAATLIAPWGCSWAAAATRARIDCISFFCPIRYGISYGIGSPRKTQERLGGGRETDGAADGVGAPRGSGHPPLPAPGTL